MGAGVTTTDRLTVRISQDARQAVKLMAAKRNVTMGEVLTEALSTFADTRQHGLIPAAWGQSKTVELFNLVDGETLQRFKLSCYATQVTARKGLEAGIAVLVRRG